MSKKITISGVLALLIFITCVKLYFFYQYFDINIFLFLDADEILLKSIYFFPYAFFLILGCLFIYKKVPEPDWQKKHINFFKFERFVLSGLLTGIILLLLVIIWTQFQNKKTIEYDIIFPPLFHYFILNLILALFYSLYLLLRVDNQENNFSSIILNENASRIFSITITLTLLICYFSITEFVRVKKNILFKNTEFHVDNKIIKCNKEILCIGFSKNYVFLYDTIKKQSIIYNIANVKLIKSNFSLNTD